MYKQTNKSDTMLRSSKSQISTQYYQLLNVIYNTQNCYQRQHHYYFNDLFYRCNKIRKLNKRQKIRKNRNKSKIKPKRKYLYEISSRIKNSNNDQDTTTAITTSVKRTENLCYCSSCSSVGYCRVNFKINKGVIDYSRYIWLYLQKDFNSIQLVIVIFLLALIMTTAHRIDIESGQPQQKSTSNSSFYVAEYPMQTKNLTVSLNCYYHLIKALRTTRSNSMLEIKPNIFNNQHNHNCPKKIKHLKKFSNYQLFGTHYRNSSNWFTNYKQLKITIDTKNNEESSIQNQNKEQDHHQQHQYDSNKQIQIFNVNILKFENITAKGEDKENLHKTSNLNINNNLLHQNIRRNYSIHKNNHNYYNIKCNNLANNTLTFSNKTLKTIMTNNKSKEDTNDIINDHVDVNVNEDDSDDDDHVEINNSYTTSLNLMSVFNTTTTSKRIPVFDDLNYQSQHRYIDRNKLMKLVMDGLGLKKAPNMQTVNISQEEYVTKYREYLQRVHMRKRRELKEVLGEYDENILRPLEIFSIVSSGTFKSHNEFSLFRQKRNIDKDHDRSYDNTDDYYNNKNQTLEERVKNILLLKKKYQKPRSTMKEREERKTNIRLMFALKEEILNLTSSDIEEANIRLVLIHSPILAIRNSKNKKTHTKPKNNSCTSNRKEGKKNLHQVNALNLKLYFISKSGKRVWLDGRKVDINVDLTKPDETHTQWLQFDVSKAVKTAVDNKRQQHVVLELICDNCKRVGARILNDAYNSAEDALADNPDTEGNQLMPILNIIGHFDQSHRIMRPHKYDHSEHHEEATTQRHYHHHQTYKNNNKNRHNNRRTNCYKANQRCCRHSMEVTFKEIKGFEFIIQPKVFDAGYCHGRCPPRYNPAHHHALLQSLIWKQNHHKAPRPCCAPSKLVELEVLHVDEKDSEKLKISTWSDMKVVECACS